MSWVALLRPRSFAEVFATGISSDSLLLGVLATAIPLPGRGLLVGTRFVSGVQRPSSGLPIHWALRRV